ncbi:uncharacterized protein LACBIDRAFT_294524 [Laccaria bicolor S238N-H82]|uniref:deoxyribose-phosphate aldolase n=1 Tax=Laccaria bicolor (strain S238N-H82 / ATCC MYA-4686) TaxID=486041 RepID=B0DCY2_LACBS|nr:uncharacterized protein LACBIDRAFT_294524 [Laccaria bicolor S238N-H82]EDR07380.1 predicted protein [Laccaria bicolor S238N-H82]|eukprot:XP_001881772.1 predicted protein [Laccaria bicolor S238N-H82]
MTSPETKDDWTDEQWADNLPIRVKLAQMLFWLTTGRELSTYDDHATLADIKSASDPRFRQSIDHTLLKPDATLEQIDKLCEEAVKYGFKSCCVNGMYIKRVAECLNTLSRDPDTRPIPCCVVGFPLGAGTAKSITNEAVEAITNGALEIDVVFPVGLLLSTPTPYSQIYHHLKTIITACHPCPVKVIIETALLPTSELKITACELATEAGAAFVKTCTGFNGGGATREDVLLMRCAVRKSVKVKASGGVRTFEACVEMFKAGAERIGTSSGATIMANANIVTSAPDADIKTEPY